MKAPRRNGYRWTNKSYAAKISAHEFGRWLEELPDQDPATMVEAARDRKSPAHKLFTWDDTQAAAEFRLTQARLLLGSFVIETIIAETKTTPRRSIVAPFVMRSGPGEYEVTTRAMKDSKKRAFMLAEAMAQLRRLKRRYAALSELAMVFAALDEVDARQARRAS